MKTHIKLLILNLLIIDATAQSLAWARSFGNTGDDFGYSIVTDASGNVYTTGHFEGSVDFDPGAGNYSLTSSGKKDIFISKLDASGNFQWALAIGDTGIDRGAFITNDPSGNLYLTGFFSGIVDFDPGPSTNTLISSSGKDIFILKITSSGNLVWARSFATASNMQYASLALDAAGNVYSTGMFTGTVDFDPGAGIFNLTCPLVGGNSAFLVKLDPSGNFIWASSTGGDQNSFNAGTIVPNAIAVDAAQNVFTTGRFVAAVDFDPSVASYTLVSDNWSYDVFISKLDANGNFIWAKAFKGSNPDWCSAISLDASANIYVCGSFGSTVNFATGAGTYTLAAAGTEDAFISKLDSTGNLIWARQLGGNGSTGAFSITRDVIGNIYTTGWFSGVSDFDPSATSYTLSSAGNFDAFISQLDPNGNFISAKSIGGMGSDYGNGIVLDNLGNICVTGIFNGTCDFDPDLAVYNLVSNGGNEAFVVKLSNCSFAITSQPGNQIATVGNTVQFMTATSNNNATFQWQEDTGSGFVNIGNSPSYSGITTATLTVNNVILAQNNYSFRCMVSEQNCVSFSNPALLTVNDLTGIKGLLSENEFTIYPNPTKDLICIGTKKLTSETYNLYDVTGKKVMQGKLTDAETKIDLRSLPEGFYFISVGNKPAAKIVKH